ncbi:MAG TPA: hypothetical protein IAA06_12605 [Candidatus Blautia faecavium]|uniref:Uncharacterized protein n=1 Tax=Candidatus Blautia faecavium TaxID=2838487 RepID=A0A9D2LUC1_9FIRM|nr:hypothetical protein [Candidatus Blautia faecavium]
MECTRQMEGKLVNHEQSIMIKIAEILAEENLISSSEKARMLQNIQEEENI